MVFIALYDGGLLSMVALMDTQGRLSTLVHPTRSARLYFSFLWKPPDPYGWPSHVRSRRTLQWQDA